MSVLKAEVKIGLSKELFEGFEGDRIKALEEQYRLQGGEKALHQARLDIDKLMDHVDKDVEAGLFDLHVSSFIKRYIERGMQICANLAEQKRLSALILKGQVHAWEQVTTRLQKVVAVETTKLQNLLESLEQPQEQTASRVVGTHPGHTLKEQRLAEGLATEHLPESSKTTQQSAEDRQSEQTPQLENSALELVVGDNPTKRKRKPKNPTNSET